jgi:hypothetical protein
MSLRKKDFVATFNWDPLLLQAYARSGDRSTLPRLIFLHGNIATGYCLKDRVVGNATAKCSRCGESFTRVPLLYPIKRKNYAENEFISSEWELFKYALREAYMITIFGYSGPKTDQEALSAMSTAWGPVAKRELEQTCFITIQAEQEVLQNFEKFVHSHHCEFNRDFYDSWIARHPRRTGEAWWNQYLECKFLPDNPIPRNATFSQLRDWVLAFRAPELELESRKGGAGP